MHFVNDFHVSVISIQHLLSKQYADTWFFWSSIPGYSSSSSSSSSLFSLFLRFSFLTRWIISEFWILFINGVLCIRSYICIENLSGWFSLAHCILHTRIVPFQLLVHCSWWFWIIYDEMVFIMDLQSRDVVKLIFPKKFLNYCIIYYANWFSVYQPCAVQMIETKRKGTMMTATGKRTKCIETYTFDSFLALWTKSKFIETCSNVQCSFIHMETRDIVHKVQNWRDNNFIIFIAPNAQCSVCSVVPYTKIYVYYSYFIFCFGFVCGWCSWDSNLFSINFKCFFLCFRFSSTPQSIFSFFHRELI